MKTVTADKHAPPSKDTKAAAASSPAALDMDKLTDNLKIPVSITLVYVSVLKWYADTPLEQWQDASSPDLLHNQLQLWWSAPIVMTVVYLLTVFCGMRYMKDKEPWNLKSAMLCYNVYQVVINVWGLWGFISVAMGNPFWSTQIDRTSGGHRVAFLIWVHYNNKYIELLDTFFMVFRKKNTQVSFLHVYHHVLLVWSWFFVTKYFPGGEAYFGATCNSFVHVVMYSYYLAASLGVSCPWKKYITQVQLLQFCACFAHAVNCLVRGLVPQWLCLLQIWVMVNMFVLFMNFYRKSYAAAKDKKAAKAGEVAEKKAM